jgi:phosphotransferase system enzyme I (PtsI)
VVIRALDLGGDKLASYLGMVRERNPFFGMRGIRYLVAHPKLFLTQLRAILRAGKSGQTRILFPMVSSIGEFHTIEKLTRRAMTGLKRQKIEFDPEPALGVMIEVPSAVMMADELAEAADFLSVGSNDLIQYMLAIDRDSQTLQDLYQPLHPAILRALKWTVEAGHRHGKPVSICGEMAGDPLSTPLLVGLGFDQFSVAPYMVPDIKQTVRAVPYEECRRLALDALDCEHAEEVKTLIEARLGSRFSDMFTLIQNSNDDSGAKGRRARASKRAEKSR